MKAVPCRTCGELPELDPSWAGTVTIRHVCCYGRRGITESEAIAEWNAANAPADADAIAALLAPDGAGEVAPDGAGEVADTGCNCGSTDGVHHSVECYLGHEVTVLLDRAGLLLGRDGTPEPGVRDAIARLLAPDGAGGVTP